MAIPTLPHPNMDFTPLDILTAAEMDKMVANDQYLRNFCDGLAKGTNIENGVIQASKISSMIYSSSEQTVGRWIDGKTIFRKVITGSSIVNANMGAFNKIIKATMVIKRSNGEWRNVPWLFADNAYTDSKWYAGFYIKQDSGAIMFQFGQDIKPTSYWHLIVEYTKN